MTRTNRSGNEIYATFLKAGRGAGLPLAQVDICARVACNTPTDAVLEAAVDHLETPPPPLSAVTADGVTLSGCHPVRDCAAVLDALAAGVPTVCMDATTGCEFMKAFASQYGLEIAATGSGGLVFTQTSNAQPSLPQRADVPDALWGRLDVLAAKTYVPETAESRLGGAGAGLTDND